METVNYLPLFPAQTGTGDDRVTRGAGPRMAQSANKCLHKLTSQRAFKAIRLMEFS